MKATRKITTHLGIMGELLTVLWGRKLWWVSC